MRINESCVGVVCWFLNKAGDVEPVGCNVDVLGSFDGIFPEIVDGVEVMSIVVAKFCAIDFDRLGASGKASNNDDEKEE